MASRKMLSQVFVLLFASKLLLAQIPGTGAIAGTVVDPSGAVFAGARVTVTNAGTRITRETTTDSAGSFRILLLPPGPYELKVNVPGFTQKTPSPVDVVVTEKTVAQIKLDLAPASSSSVQVVETSDAVQTESITLGRAIDERTITALPLANRNYSQILALSPGTVVELPNAGALGKNTQNISVNGAKTTANNFQFNGVDAVNLAENSASGFGSNIGIAIPAPDVISEFKVQTGLYDASYGRSAGANVDMVSRSGSNRFHATLWEFFRNDALNANDFFLNRNNQPRPVLRQNQFGFAAGGPIRKDSTFIFGSYQGTLQKNGVASVSLQTAFLPTLGSDRSAQAIAKVYGGLPGALGGETIAAPGQFALRRRVRHVLGEAERVAAAEQALRHDDLAALGELMNDSHRSCAEDYEVSTPALDQLAALARAHGALGARLTGAGFGGAIVALVERDRSAALIAALDRHFYATRGGRSDLRLAVEAGGGAVVERLGDAT